MPINLVVAVTDSDWFETLRRRLDLTEVNFWAPSGTGFKAAGTRRAVSVQAEFAT